MIKKLDYNAPEDTKLLEVIGKVNEVIDWQNEHMDKDHDYINKIIIDHEKQLEPKPDKAEKYYYQPQNCPENKLGFHYWTEDSLECAYCGASRITYTKPDKLQELLDWVDNTIRKQDKISINGNDLIAKIKQLQNE